MNKESYFCKKCNQKEIDNINTLISNGALVFPDCIILNNKNLIEYNLLTSVSICDLSIKSVINLCAQKLSMLHMIKSPSYSPALYKYYRINDELKTTELINHIPYKEFLKAGLQSCLRLLDKVRINKLQFGLVKLLSEKTFYAIENINLSTQSYSLLHGDLHIGNLLFDERPSNLFLIDFEHCMYGIKELDIANILLSITYNKYYNTKDIGNTLSFLSQLIDDIETNYPINKQLLYMALYLITTLDYIKQLLSSKTSTIVSQDIITYLLVYYHNN